MTLPSAPEFDADGTWPPVTTDWTPVRWELFEAGSSEKLASYARYVLWAPFPGELVIAAPLLTNINLHEGVLEYHNELRDLPALPLGSSPPYELRRLVYAQRWRRQHPVTQSPPGAEHEVTHSVTTGLTAENSKALSRALGLNLGGNIAGIQARINSQIIEESGLRLEITAQQEKTRKLTLANQSASNYRRYALWHVDHRVTDTALELLRSSITYGSLEWADTVPVPKKLMKTSAQDGCNEERLSLSPRTTRSLPSSRSTNPDANS